MRDVVAVFIPTWRGKNFLCLSNEERGVHLPGGKVEAGEVWSEACLREIWEELQVRIKWPQFLGSRDSVLPGFIVHFYRAELQDSLAIPTPEPGHSIVEGTWADLIGSPLGASYADMQIPYTRKFGKEGYGV